MKKELQKKQLTLNKETVSELNHVKAGQGAPGDANSLTIVLTPMSITICICDDPTINRSRSNFC